MTNERKSVGFGEEEGEGASNTLVMMMIMMILMGMMMVMMMMMMVMMMITSQIFDVNYQTQKSIIYFWQFCIT